MDSNTIQRLVELLSEEAVARIWRELDWYAQHGQAQDAEDAQTFVTEIGEALESLYDFPPDNVGDYMAEYAAELDAAISK